MSEGEIEARAKAIRIPLTELAASAGLNKHTVYNATKGSDMRNSTRVRLLRALETEERRLLDHLLKLHGADQGRAA